MGIKGKQRRSAGKIVEMRSSRQEIPLSYYNTYEGDYPNTGTPFSCLAVNLVFDDS
jgi:hypothetical protein